MKKLFLLLSLFSSPLHAEGWRLLYPTEAHVDLYKYKGVHDPYLAPIDGELTQGATFNLSFDILKYNQMGLYWNNELHFDQSGRTNQVKHGGWKYELGASLFRLGSTGGGVDVFHQHHSRHIFEEDRKAHFPVYDRYGIRLKILDLK